MVRRLLVPLDGSQLAAAAIPYALTLAHALDIPAELLAVVPPFPELPSVPSAQAVAGDERRVALDSAYLASVATTIGTPARTVRTAIRHGNPAGEILCAPPPKSRALSWS